MSSNSIFTLIILIVLSLCQCKPEVKKTDIHELAWLQGTWMSQDRLILETWALQNEEMVGNVYDAGKGKITEVLKMVKCPDGLCFEATVNGQNSGQPVQFVLTSKNADSLSFENKNHDFPNVILYRKVTDTTLYYQIGGKTNANKPVFMKKLKE